MPEFTAVEIDEEDDWIISEKLFKKHINIQAQVFNSDLKIKLFLSDVDGVLTDAGMYYSENGDELKKFNTHDGMGFKILRNNGIRTGIITSETTKIVERRAKKLNVDFLYQARGEEGKLNAALEIANQLNISLKEVAYIGDDLNCNNLLTEVGIAACPMNALQCIKDIPGINILSKKGGEGVVREFVEMIISHNKVFNDE